MVQMGDPADALYLFKSGEVAVHKANEAGNPMRMNPKPNPKPKPTPTPKPKPTPTPKPSPHPNPGDLMRMKAGEFFGESALQSEGATVLTRQANVVAVGPVTAPRLTLTMTIILARTLTQMLTRTRTRTRTLTR